MWELTVYSPVVLGSWYCNPLWRALFKEIIPIQIACWSDTKVNHGAIATIPGSKAEIHKLLWALCWCTVHFYYSVSMFGPGACRDQKRASGTLELESQVVVSFHVCIMWVSCRGSNPSRLVQQQLLSSAEPPQQPYWWQLKQTIFKKKKIFF